MEEAVSFRGRVLTAGELHLVREIIEDFPHLSQAGLAHTIFELLEWRRPNGAEGANLRIRAKLMMILTDYTQGKRLRNLARRTPLLYRRQPQLDFARHPVPRQFITRILLLRGRPHEVQIAGHRHRSPALGKRLVFQFLPQP